MLTADEVISLCRLHGQRAEILSHQANLAAKLNRIVVAEDANPSDRPGSWTCKGCGFRGFWSGGPHCLPADAGSRFTPQEHEREREWRKGGK